MSSQVRTHRFPPPGLCRAAPSGCSSYRPQPSIRVFLWREQNTIACTWHCSCSFLSVRSVSTPPVPKRWSVWNPVHDKSDAPILLWKVMRITQVNSCKSSLKTGSFYRHERWIACLHPISKYNNPMWRAVLNLCYTNERTEVQKGACPRAGAPTHGAGLN